MQQYITALLPYVPKLRLFIWKEKNNRLNKKRKVSGWSVSQLIGRWSLPSQIIANQLGSDRVIFRLYLVGMFPAEQAGLFAAAFLLSLHPHWLGMKHPAVADCWNGIQTQWLHFSLSAKYLPIGECPLPRLRGIVEMVGRWGFEVGRGRKQPEDILSFLDCFFFRCHVQGGCIKIT